MSLLRRALCIPIALMLGAAPAAAEEGPPDAPPAPPAPAEPAAQAPADAAIPQSPQTPPADAQKPAPVAAPATPPAASDASAPAPMPITLELKDGQEIHGYLVEDTSTSITVELIGGGRMVVPRSAVSRVQHSPNYEVRADGELWFADPNRTRYYYGPSAMMLREGEVTLSQKFLFFTSVGYGLTDNISLQAGAFLPGWFFGRDGFNAIVGAKLGKELAPGVHLAGGLQAIVVPSEGAGGLGFGTLTLGSHDRHISVSAGVPWFTARGEIEVTPNALFTLAGNLRLGQHIALVSENWLFPEFGQGAYAIVHAQGVRFMGRHLAVDIAIMGSVTRTAQEGGGYVVDAIALPIPWLDFTYNF